VYVGVRVPWFVCTAVKLDLLPWGNIQIKGVSKPDDDNIHTEYEVSGG
jgi:hypothetical protein